MMDDEEPCLTIVEGPDGPIGWVRSTRKRDPNALSEETRWAMLLDLVDELMNKYAQRVEDMSDDESPAAVGDEQRNADG